MNIDNTYDVGIYLRLSKDDNNGHLESMSISNQRQLLKDFVLEKGWKLVEEYVDDGWTGTNFERPSFKRMIDDALNGKINCIITKDLSRLGRNYVQAGYYTDEFFPENDIRYIAINDSIDTINDDNDMTAFHHVLNEIYPKQVSKKVRQVKRKSAEQGMFMGSQAPYGYKKSPEDKHILIIDDEAALIIKRLFNEFASGDTARQIADRLNEEKVDSPRFYHYAKMGRINPLTEEKNVWGSATVLQLLRNQVYIGNMVQGKRKTVSFKTKKMRQVSPENWIVVENTHEPIVERELWDKVHNRMRTNSRVAKTKEKTVGMFAGILRCADCNSPLAYMRKKLANGEKGLYRCSRYNNNGSNACGTHYIEEDDLCEIVLNDIRRYAVIAENEKETIANKLLTLKSKHAMAETKVIRGQISNAENRLAVIKTTIKNLYIDKCSGNLPEEVFKSMMEDFLKEQSDLENQIPRLHDELEQISTATDEVNEWLNLISDFTNIETLTRAIVCELIESITVSDRQKVNGKWEQSIDIRYRFIGNLLQDEETGAKKENIA